MLCWLCHDLYVWFAAASVSPRMQASWVQIPPKPTNSKITSGELCCDCDFCSLVSSPSGILNKAQVRPAVAITVHDKSLQDEKGKYFTAHHICTSEHAWTITSKATTTPQQKDKATQHMYNSPEKVIFQGKIGCLGWDTAHLSVMICTSEHAWKIKRCWERQGNNNNRKAKQHNTTRPRQVKEKWAACSTQTHNHQLSRQYSYQLSYQGSSAGWDESCMQITIYIASQPEKQVNSPQPLAFQAMMLLIPTNLPKQLSWLGRIHCTGCIRLPLHTYILEHSNFHICNRRNAN